MSNHHPLAQTKRPTFQEIATMSEYNARLWFAAPKMLELLKKLREESSHSSLFTKEVDEVITKVEGDK